ncbi:MAG: hypothetical protein F8N36_13655 [Desulfovibrio sp.]|uniref:hypothetical protein n=1 Tax=Desulfovibrio sp. TaxID=885 RepID=UPI00135DE508|nr:hypothetical protein [Desulfovibrio sp.]MTJ93885.1 hypothetical protein [Desulfovibrio sp.]
MTYEEAQSRLPKGCQLWGNFGDGLWRASFDGWENLIEPAKTIDEAFNRALVAVKKFCRAHGVA